MTTAKDCWNCAHQHIFLHQKHHRVLWRHPKSKHWHQLDLIITRRSFLQSFTITKRYHSANCDTDHLLVCCKVKLQPKKFYRTKQPRTAKVDVSKTRHPDKAATFSSTFDSLFDNTYGLLLRNCGTTSKQPLTQLPSLPLERKKEANKMTCTQKTEKLDPFVQAKRKALQAYKDRPTQANLSVLQSARKQVKSEVKACVNDYWSNLCSAVQQASDTGNIKAMYDGIKKAVGSTISKSAPLKFKSGDIISDKTKKLER